MGRLDILKASVIGFAAFSPVTMESLIEFRQISQSKARIRRRPAVPQLRDPVRRTSRSLRRVRRFDGPIRCRRIPQR